MIRVNVNTDTADVQAERPATTTQPPVVTPYIDNIRSQSGAAKRVVFKNDLTAGEKQLVKERFIAYIDRILQEKFLSVSCVSKILSVPYGRAVKICDDCNKLSYLFQKDLGRGIKL